MPHAHGLPQIIFAEKQLYGLARLVAAAALAAFSQRAEPDGNRLPINVIQHFQLPRENDT